jgi:TolB protein
VGAGLVVVRLDGSRARLSRGPDVAPSWSPDGKLIAFVRGRGEKRAVVAIEADGGTERQLANGAAAVRPAWSPDGSRLAFLRSQRPVLLDVKSLAQRGVPGVRVDEYDVDDATLAWSPEARGSPSAGRAVRSSSRSTGGGARR